ncbi:helix-hairpin-helix domain-containing protein [Candidatus Collierbacteria bacterium]|nr:helix-hairpin-helix domain-containing protein [Candidatus Collierbacteria bacterium]
MESGEERRKRAVGLLSLFLLLTGLGTLAGLALFSSENSRVEVIKDNRQWTMDGGESAKEMVVDVAGAVEKPGVYKLGQGARIVDALAAAGGLSGKADRDFLSKTINLSQLVTDGMKVYIKPIGEDKGSREAGSGSAGEIGGIGEIIYINSASREELETLWGVGQARAEAIIAGRPYSSVEELLTKKILPKNVVEKNRMKLNL